MVREAEQLASRGESRRPWTATVGMVAWVGAFAAARRPKLCLSAAGGPCERARGAKLGLVVAELAEHQATSCTPTAAHR